MEYTTAKFFHLIGVFLWVASSSSLGLFMIYGNFKDTKCDKHIIRNFYRWMTNLEIAGFVLALAMGFYMLHLLKYRFDINWLNYKLPIVLLLFLPLEVLNFWFVNIHIPKSQDKEKAYKRYDLFNYIVALPLLVGGLVVVYLAVVKP
jgi:putative membrane protein